MRVCGFLERPKNSHGRDRSKLKPQTGRKHRSALPGALQRKIGPSITSYSSLQSDSNKLFQPCHGFLLVAKLAVVIHLEVQQHGEVVD